MGPDLPKDCIPWQSHQEYAGEKDNSVIQKFGDGFPLQAIVVVGVAVMELADSNGEDGTMKEYWSNEVKCEA